MARLSLPPLAAVSDRPRVRESAWLFLPVFGSTILWVAVTAGAESASRLVATELDPQLAGAVTYAVLAVATLAVVYVAVLHLRDVETGLDRFELLQLGGIAGLLSLVGAYWLLGTTDLPAFPGDLLTVLLAGPVGMGALAYGYAEARGFDLRIAVPDRDAAPHAIVTVLVAVAVSVGWLLALAATATPFFPFPTDTAVVLRLSGGELVWNVVAPGVLVGVGWGILYNGALQEGLREYVGPARAVAAVTALIGVLAMTTGLPFRTTGLVATVGATIGVVVLSLVAAFLAARVAGFLSRTSEAASSPAAAGAVGVLLVALSLVGVSAVYSSPPGLVPVGLGATAVAAVACVAYERSRSVWVASLAFATYFVVADVNLARYVLGLIY